MLAFPESAPLAAVFPHEGPTIPRRERSSRTIVRAHRVRWTPSASAESVQPAGRAVSVRHRLVFILKNDRKPTPQRIAGMLFR